MKKIFNIKVGSITDVITNSSTEVFTVYSDNGIDFIKRMVNNILSLKGGNDLKFDDLFNVRYNFDLNYIVQAGDGVDNLYVVHELSVSELKEWINLGDDDDKKEDFLLNLPYEKLLNICTAYEDDEYDRAGKCINGITVTPKEGIADVNNDIVKSVADILSHLSDGIWSYYAIASY